MRVRVYVHALFKKWVVGMRVYNGSFSGVYVHLLYKDMGHGISIIVNAIMYIFFYIEHVLA